MASKKFKGKDCAYCGGEKMSSEGDHVVARKFFFEADRADLPQVPACRKCNGDKAELETYAMAALMAGSNLDEGDRYRQQMVRPRLAKNVRLQREMGMLDPPVMLNFNGIIQPMHALKIEAAKIELLMGLIAVGLYHYHTGELLSRQFRPDVYQMHPDHEAAHWASFAEWFPHGARRFGNNFGHGSFVYEGAQSPVQNGFTVWRMSWHNGIRLHGENTPPQGIGVWWVITRPTDEALAAKEIAEGGGASRLDAEGSSVLGNATADDIHRTAESP